MTATAESIELAARAAHAADNRGGESIACYDVSDVMAISDVFVVVTAGSERQVGAIVEEVEDALTDIGVEPLRREGHRENRWVLLDYGQFVVHVQRVQEREFYGLDRLYADCPLLPVAGIDGFERTGHYADEVDTRHIDSIDDLPFAGEGPVDPLDEER